MPTPPPTPTPTPLYSVATRTSLDLSRRMDDYGDSALYSAHPVQRLALSRHATSSRNAAPAPMGTPRSPSCAANAARRRVTGMRFYRKGMGVKCTVTVIRAFKVLRADVLHQPNPRALNLNRHSGAGRNPAQKITSSQCDVVCLQGLGPGLRRDDG